uniref:Uncharacterized protein n=1 Tax=Anguilla anguilla TaxID=7936 RepID=A0A0E9UXR5_ANGAN
MTGDSTATFLRTCADCLVVKGPHSLKVTSSEHSTYSEEQEN